VGGGGCVRAWGWGWGVGVGVCVRVCVCVSWFSALAGDSPGIVLG